MNCNGHRSQHPEEGSTFMIQVGEGGAVGQSQWKKPKTREREKNFSHGDFILYHDFYFARSMGLVM